MAYRANVLKARVARRPVTGGTSAPRNAGPRQPKGSGGTSAPASAGGGYSSGLNQNRQPHSRWQANNVGGPPTPVSLAGAPGAPAPAEPAPMPWDAQYNTSVAGADKNYGDKYAYLQSKRLNTQQAFGIDSGFNDYANNPYSRAALLRKSYDTSVRGSTNSYAAGGHLYSGSLHNAQGANRGNYDRGYDDLNREYLASLGDIDREVAQAVEDRERAKEEAGWRRLEVAGDEPLEAETAPESVKNKAKQKHKKKKGKGQK